jgi:outer membrane protein TolC
MLNRRLLAVPIAVVLALPAAPGIAFAQEGGEEARLSLDECLRAALENNLDLVSARKDPQIAEQEVVGSEAAFDPALGGRVDYSETEGDQVITDSVGNTTDGNSDSDELTGGVSWSQLLRFGATYEVGLNLGDSDDLSSTIEAATGFFQNTARTQSYEGLSLSYSMPLLQGFGTEVNTIDVLLAQSGLEISKENLRFEATRIMKQVEDAYWDLLATQAALDVARESLELAEDLYELNKKKVEVGTLAPIDVTQAEAGVASREEGVIVAETSVANAEDNLRRLLGIPPADPMWSQRIVPTDRPVFEERPIDLGAAIETAMEKRPEMISARQDLEDSELSERVARNGVRHKLDLEVGYNPYRYDTDQLVEIIVPPTAPSDTNIDGDGTDWRVGLVYSYPIRNRQAKANLAIARINVEKQSVALQNAEQEIRVDVRTAARNVESGGKRVAAARANTTLQRKTLEAEQRKYENGMSTSFEVLRIQTDLSDARLAEIRAILDYVKALADFERAKGTLLEARGLALGS